jgi:hypothetical protein
MKTKRTRTKGKRKRKRKRKRLTNRRWCASQTKTRADALACLSYNRRRYVSVRWPTHFRVNKTDDDRLVVVGNISRAELLFRGPSQPPVGPPAELTGFGSAALLPAMNLNGRHCSNRPDESAGFFFGSARPRDDFTAERHQPRPRFGEPTQRHQLWLHHSKQPLYE